MKRLPRLQGEEASKGPNNGARDSDCQPTNKSKRRRTISTTSDIEAARTLARLVGLRRTSQEASTSDDTPARRPSCSIVKQILDETNDKTLSDKQQAKVKPSPKPLQKILEKGSILPVENTNAQREIQDLNADKKYLDNGRFLNTSEICLG